MLSDAASTARPVAPAVTFAAVKEIDADPRWNEMAVVLFSRLVPLNVVESAIRVISAPS